MLNFSSDKDKPDDGDIKLPALNPLIKLFKSTPGLDGQPRWSLYQAAANQYYQINWAEFECLARFHKHERASTLIEEVNKQTTLEIDLNDIKALILFLQQNGLLVLVHQQPEIRKNMSLWKKLVHNYLFLTLPLFKPTSFLERTLPFVRPLLSKGFMVLMMGLLLIGIVMTIQRFDEFTHTFLDMLSVRGAIITFFVFTAIKIIHEFAHAYIATKHGVKIPHMGLALIVMYPVLYTETTASWQLDSRKKRIEIGLAGVMAELALAAIFLMLWHIMPPGIGQSVAFSVVVISLIGSLFVNLNPMMRFDGYFVLSDALNIENLHARAIAIARWRLREALFGLGDPAPEPFTPSLARFMTFFGFAVILYRFFLFLGIALLVYAVFFKPMGLLMMLIELLWFIGIPIWKELKIWWERRCDIVSRRRSLITASILAIVLGFLLMPMRTHIAISGVLQADKYKAVQAPSSAFIRKLNIHEGQTVKKGDILAILESDTLEQELESAKINLNNLEGQQRREKTDIALYRERGGTLENEIDAAQQNIKTLQKQKDKLIITASFNGTIRDLSPEIHAGRYISRHKRLFHLIKANQSDLIAYVNENQLPRIKAKSTAEFHPDFSLFLKEKFIVTSIDPVNVKTISKPELTSLHGGNIPATVEGEAIVPLEPVYKIRLKSLNKNNILSKSSTTQKGQIRIQATRQSALLSTFKRLIALIIRESGLN
ncbi:MAG: efflux RND transporter periplasmic adaptor subunit [Bdellovibrionales bacterium]